MAKERSFSNRVIWDDPDIVEIKRRIEYLDQGNFVSNESSDFESSPPLDTPGPLPPDPGPPTPPGPTPLPYPWPISVKSTEYTNDALGNPAANVTITWTDIPGASSYQVRVTKL